jgi:hypothetical protein
MIFSNVDLPTPLTGTPEQPFCSLNDEGTPIIPAL